jgi:hypothetical protein
VTRGRAASRILAVLVASVTVTHAAGAQAAAKRARHRFEPTDLRLLEGGAAEIDVQAGVIAGDQVSRAYAPDFEASVGLSRYAELEVDGAFGLDHYTDPQFVDNTLVALRVAVVDVRDSPDSRARWSLGFQAGPRLPSLIGAHGIGLEALAIAGRSGGRVHVFAQAGVLVDPAMSTDGARAVRPFGVEGGLDLDLDLDESETWSLKAELGGVQFVSQDPSQLHATVGPAVAVASWLELSAVGVVGLLPGGDRVGLLLGAASRFVAF